MAKSTRVTTENNCDVNESLEVLSDLYKNVTMAQNTIKILLPYVEDNELTKQLHQQVEKYDEYTEKIDTVAKNLNFEPSPSPQFTLTMAGMGIRIKMATDRSRTHIAKIMLQGTLNGIIDLYRLAKKLYEVHPEIALLLRQVLKYEETRFEWMKGQL